MIEVDCYICKSNNNEYYDSENGHNIVKCFDCGLLFLNPRPGLDEIDEASKSGMHKGDELLKVTGKFKEYLKNCFVKFAKMEK